MKIQPGYFPPNNKIQRTDTNSRPREMPNFGDLMQQNEEGRTQEELQRKLEDIRQQGDRLMRSMTVRELKLYRMMVKGFLEDTLKRGIALKETKGWDRRGRGKRYKILEEVDSMLVAMGEELLGSEEGRLELLQKVGEIRGLLINLVF
ncbi:MULTISPECIES: YaaR family protein [Cohnella]|uniref:YaaR family protein n=1 Tax=Cohnella hashimotonis TaxID=2826895 RepID=A0ABT6TRI4_9BACL|nr:YaaR family protein [Cohnella hashimotonis]MDI4649440.1 YaaR family protein [Cohnella hashimotonis]